MEPDARDDRVLFAPRGQAAAEIQERLASPEQFAGSPDLSITSHLVREVEIDEHRALLLIDDLREGWRAAQTEGEVPVRQGFRDGEPAKEGRARELEVTGGVILEHLAMQSPLTSAWADALIDLVVDDAPGEWFDRVLTTLADNQTLPADCRTALLAAARRTDLSGFHPHMMGPDFETMLSRIPLAVAAHPAPMSPELLRMLLDGDVNDELLTTLLDRPDLSDEQYATIAEAR